MRPDYHKAMENAAKSIFEANLSTMMKRMTPADRAQLFEELSPKEPTPGTFEVTED